MSSLPETMHSLTSTVRQDKTLLLALEESPLPQIEDGQLLVRIEATPINPSDLAGLLARADMSDASATSSSGQPAVQASISDGAFAGLSGRVDQSLTFGNEAAGVVVAPADSPLIGKAVAVVGGQMYTQYRVMGADKVLPLPEGTEPRQAASWFVNPLTALGMVETMRLDKHTAIVHTAAASQLGQMLVKLCIQQSIPLVNIVRRDEQAELLKGIGAQYVLNSSSDSFDQDLAAAIAETNATIAFDATGGGTLAPQILAAMEAGAKAAGAEANWYGTDTYKQVYVYGGLDKSPLTFTPSWFSAGFNWSVGGFLLNHVLKRVGPERTKELYGQVAAGLATTFSTTYTAEVSFQELLLPDVIQLVAAQATGQKYLLNPNKA